MPRRSSGKGDDVYRVMVVKVGFDGPVTRFFGPYATLGAAKGVLTRETEYCGVQRAHVISSHIERAETNWSTVK